VSVRHNQIRIRSTLAGRRRELERIDKRLDVVMLVMDVVMCKQQ
jgi:hypothetical protein